MQSQPSIEEIRRNAQAKSPSKNTPSQGDFEDFERVRTIKLINVNLFFYTIKGV